MNLGDLFTGWSAAHVVWFGGAIALAAYNSPNLTPKERMQALFTSLICLGLAWHQGEQMWRWMLDMYTAKQVSLATWIYRICWSVGVVGFGGVTSWERCGHRGWIGLLLVGLLAGAIAVAMSP